MIPESGFWKPCPKTVVSDDFLVLGSEMSAEVWAVNQIPKEYEIPPARRLPTFSLTLYSTVFTH